MLNYICIIYYKYQKIPYSYMRLLACKSTLELRSIVMNKTVSNILKLWNL